MNKPFAAIIAALEKFLADLKRESDDLHML
jgi:hypothetical protein